MVDHHHLCFVPAIPLKPSSFHVAVPHRGMLKSYTLAYMQWNLPVQKAGYKVHMRSAAFQKSFQ
jgi:hypothetical protein